MAKDPQDAPSLDAAYALDGPDDNRRLYRDWADSYDAEFADAMSYALPRAVAQVYAQMGGGGPVLDVGAGTGLLAEALLPLADLEIDALDLSAEMLAVADGKGVYRRLIQADLTQKLTASVNQFAGHYAGVVSSGTFTHGHVGPDALDKLLPLAQPGGLCVLSVNAEHFEARGFAEKFQQIKARITDLELREVAIYGDTADAAHAEDKALLAIFRTL